MHIQFLAFLLLPLASFVCAAQADCTVSPSLEQRLTCIETESERAENDMMSAFRQLLNQSSDSGKADLIASQKLWLAYKTAWCDYVVTLAPNEQPNTAAELGIYAAQCHIEQARLRGEQLKRRIVPDTE